MPLARWLVFAAVFAGPSALAAPALKDAPAKPSVLVGEWRLETSTTDGAVSRITGEVVYVFTADGRHGRREGTGPPAWFKYRADDRADPPALDILADPAGAGPTTFRKAFRVEGDTLTICFPLAGEARPRALASEKGSDTRTYTLRRVKPKD
jgi:uncharacterized protein (TIGR03067 family)